MKNIIKFSVLFVSIFVTNIGYAQYGLRIKYNKSNYDDWSNALKSRTQIDEKLFKNGLEVGVDYWFRLKKHRVEFLPELAFGGSQNSLNNDFIDKVNLTHYGFNFHTQIYALDLEGDCNCPTFSKQGPSINKGFFLHLTPGVEVHNAKITGANPTLDVDPVNSSAVVGKIGLGLGLDLGISDFLTITPMISYYYYTKATWKNLALTQSILSDAITNPSKLQFSIRFGLRSDYGKKGRR